MKVKEICEYGIKSKVKAGEGLTEGKYKFFTSSAEANKFVNEYQFDKPGIIMGTGGNATLHYCDTPFSVSTDCIVLFPKDKLITKYLYYFFRGNFHILENGFKGAGLKHTSKKYINEIKIKKIPIQAKQEQIIDVLDNIEDIITRKKQQLLEYDQLIKSRFVEMFGEVEFNTNSYKLVKYGDVFELNAGGTPSRRKTEYWENGTISWIGSNLCQNNIIYENDGQYITEEGYKNSSAKLFPIDTVLVALVGATIGKTALLKFETTTNQNVLGIRNIRESGFNPYFVYYYTQGLYNRFINIGGGGFSMASKKFISDLDIAMVKLEDQNKFAKFVQQVDKLKFEVLKLLRELR